MHGKYTGVVTRFLRKDERLIQSEDTQLPLVIEPKGSTDVLFLQSFVASHSPQLLEDISQYGAVLLRGFAIQSDNDFEKTVLSIKGFQGISDVFMSEEGRIHPDGLKYVLHTNAVYKTGGTLYLGGFHSENYYSPDVPGYICFCCLKPSERGGETGLVNMEKVYQHLNDSLKKKLEKNSFFVSKWLVSEVAARYQIAPETIVKIAHRFDLPLIGEGDEQFILMYKPSVLEDPRTKKRSLHINQFEIANLNEALRICFSPDYKGKEWFWHRLVWKLPRFIFKLLEVIYMSFASFFYSPKNALNILFSKCKSYKAAHTDQLPPFNQIRVGSCFNEQDVNDLARIMKNHYASCLWKKGDILLVDNKKVVHTGMPGKGQRLIRVIIGNPMDMQYSLLEPGTIEYKYRTKGTIGSEISSYKKSL